MIDKLAKAIIETATEKNILIATAESCTGGMISSALTSIPGSSLAFDCGFITYSEYAKQRLLGVDKEILSTYGVISKEVAQAMTLGAIKNSQATLSIATTGIAGPSQGSSEKPVGLVYIAKCYKGVTTVEEHFFSGTRQEIRHKATVRALEFLSESISS